MPENPFEFHISHHNQRFFRRMQHQPVSDSFDAKASFVANLGLSGSNLIPVAPIDASTGSDPGRTSNESFTQNTISGCGL